MATHSIFLPRESHGQRSPVGYSPRGHKESDLATKQQQQRLLLFIIITTIYPSNPEIIKSQIAQKMGEGR